MNILIDIMWYLFIVTAFIFCTFGLDALFVDIYYTIYSIYRHFKSRKYPRLTYEQLALKPEQRIAIFVACWHEADVIGAMLRLNTRNIDYKNYTIFVGVYPNDPDTINVVQAIAATTPHVHCVIGPDPGPTCKAANLNIMYDALLAEEIASGNAYHVFVLHDSEDVIHPLSLKLYNYLIPRKDMVQIPVYPLEVNYFNFTHWIYNDEFAENHTKNMIVREAMGGLVPSAGVGTALSQRAIQTLIEHNPNKAPFALNLLTEDYSSSLEICIAGLKSIFVSQWVWRTRTQSILWGMFHYERKYKDHIATRSYFPTEYMKAVRQKTRWIIGITLQEWMRSGWKGKFAVRYTLFQDRRTIVSQFINGFAYIILLFWLFYTWWQIHNPQYPTVKQIFNRWPPIHLLIIIATLMMFERLLQRVIACWRIYGVIPALLSIPRSIYGNILNLHASMRAYYQFFLKPKNKAKAPAWDKTEHIFLSIPGLQPGNKKLGEYLVEQGYLSPRQCIEIINEQTRTGKKIGAILMANGIITKQQLMTMVANQYNLEVLLAPPKILPLDELPLVSNKGYNWLKRKHFIPFRFTENKTLVVGITDPTDRVNLEKMYSILGHFHLQYALFVRN